MKHIGQQALILGASMGGLLAARVLADYTARSRLSSATNFRQRASHARACRRDATRMAFTHAGAS